jgi:hypothetical protein
MVRLDLVICKYESFLGDTPFVYLVFNKTLSREVVILIKSLFAKRKPEIVNLSSFVTAPSPKAVVEVEEIKFSAI